MIDEKHYNKQSILGCLVGMFLAFGLVTAITWLLVLIAGWWW